jgi:hypothetical protein
MTFDRNQLIAALVLAATVLFLMSGAPGMPGGSFRLWARRAAITIYGAAFLGVVVYVALWLCGDGF